MKDNNPPVVPFKHKPGPDKLRIFFTIHLNRIYCAKTHLVSRLPEIERNAHFNDLQLVEGGCKKSNRKDAGDLHIAG